MVSPIYTNDQGTIEFPYPYFSRQNDNLVTDREWQLNDSVAPTAFLVSLTTTCPHSPPTAKL